MAGMLSVIGGCFGRIDTLRSVPIRLVLTKLDVFEQIIEEHDMAPVFNRYVRLLCHRALN